ncbi:unnamed protein product [Anisakis simplex]|uniref:TDP43_N domain-containing protein n=1 Tax=Anisakis simplex TaxID=6269 RepID=A0A158PPF5_ANISI|nr:unnamed protein product [Anisakis simplex]
MNDPPGTVSDGDRPTGWVRLQLEPVDVPLEADESLLLSTVQSAIPGAHGLYYKEDDQKKAFRFDSSTGKFYQGQLGWNAKPIFVNLAHGCRTLTLGQYESATKTFEKSVSAVERMLGASDWRTGATAQEVDGTLSFTVHVQQGTSRSRETRRFEDKEKTHEKRLTRPTKSGFEAQAEALEDHSDGSIDSATSKELLKLQEENENLKQELHTIRDNCSKFEHDVKEKGKDLMEARLRIDELLREIEHIKPTGYLDSSITESERALYTTTTVISTPQKTPLLDLEEFVNLKRVKEEAERELARERENIEQLEKIRNEQVDTISKLEWSLGEHKHWLEDARSKVNQLEGQINGQTAEFERTRSDLQSQIDRLHEMNCQLKNELQMERTENERLNAELEKLKTTIGDTHPEVGAWEDEKTNLGKQIEELKGQITAKENEASALRSENDWLKNELKGKDTYINELNKLKNDAEWNLGEHRQWLSDANNRIIALEAELQSKVEELNQLHAQRSAGVDQGQETISRLEVQITEVQTLLQKTNEEKDEKERQIEETNKKVRDLTDEVNNKNKEIEELKNDAERKLEEHRQWLNDANNRNDELSRQVDQLKNEQEILKKQIETADKLEISQALTAAPPEPQVFIYYVF